MESEDNDEPSLPYLDPMDPNYDPRQDVDPYWCSAYTPAQATTARKAAYLQAGITTENDRKTCRREWNKKHLPNFMNVEKERQRRAKVYKKQDQLTDQQQLDRVETWRVRTRRYRATPNRAETRQRHRERLQRAGAAALARAQLPRPPRNN